MTTGWFDERNRLTPEELQAVTFPMSRLGRRGYEEEPVRAFLREVHAEFVRLVNERASLWQDVQRLRRRIIAGGGDGDSSGVLFGEADSHVHAVRILSTAQVTADRYVADAQAYSGRLTEEARVRRDEIITQAQQHGEMLLQEARTRAREAALAAMNRDPVPPASEHERRALQGEMAYLRTFNDVYRQHLRVYTEAVLRSIEDWERRERTMPQEVQVVDQGQPGLSRPPR